MPKPKSIRWNRGGMKMQRGRDGSGTPRRRKGSSPPGQCPHEHSALQDDTGDARGKRWGRGWFRILLVSLKRNSEGKKKEKKTTENHKDPLPLTFLVQRFGVWVLGFFVFLFVCFVFVFFFVFCFSSRFFRTIFKNVHFIKFIKYFHI